MSHIAVIGAGAWGTALALMLAGKGERVRLWTWQAAHAAALVADRENREFFPGFVLPDAVAPSADLAEVVGGAEFVIVVVPTAAFRATLGVARTALPARAPIVVASKGIESESHQLLSEVIAEVLGPDAARRSAFLSGPSFAVEVAKGMPTNVVVAAQTFELSESVQQRFATERFRIYASDDPIGVQVGGALKNVIAIAAGASDGLGFGTNTRAALITRGIAELGRLAIAKGGSVLSLAGLAGLGDLVLTCTGELSRNRTVGVEMGKGRSLDTVLRSLGHVAEGVTTAKSAYALGRQLNVDLPICTAVYRVLYENKPLHDAVSEILHRPLKREWAS
jgi:glycerol-3-phosphate dehydrogenase (NAD(P)+)